ncbi:hypothetical protein SS50377_21607 [Spironucleus salmonicida]|nr:hypothetical protein SS50377_21607 [Spironucleus salmonicida]
MFSEMLQTGDSGHVNTVYEGINGYGHLPAHLYSKLAGGQYSRDGVLRSTGTPFIRPSTEARNTATALRTIAKVRKVRYTGSAGWPGVQGVLQCSWTRIYLIRAYEKSDGYMHIGVTLGIPLGLAGISTASAGWALVLRI